MRLSTLFEWLSYLEAIHPTQIDLGLDRVKRVAEKLGLLKPNCPVIIVGGTNGKGSTVAGLEAIYRAAGYQVGAFTSPYLFKLNEEVRMNGQPASDLAFCEAFAKIEVARGEISLTQFEFCTLAALIIFQQHSLDVLILEVGLGGRLDAVNILDADVSIVTTIAIDHVAWLGATREEIGFEKAGIFRTGRPAICGDPKPPSSLVNVAKSIGAEFVCLGSDYSYSEEEQHWSWETHLAGFEAQLPNLPRNHLLTQNMATVLMAVTLLARRLPVDRVAIENGLKNVELLGRIQIIPGPVTHIIDVAHNPAAVAVLTQRLQVLPCAGKTRAVFSMLADKDILGTVKIIQSVIDEWYIAAIDAKRAASLPVLTDVFDQLGMTPQVFNSLELAYAAAKAEAVEGDRIITFGSFYTVGEVFS